MLFLWNVIAISGEEHYISLGGHNQNIQEAIFVHIILQVHKFAHKNIIS